jgi:hypothetical protein
LNDPRALTRLCRGGPTTFHLYGACGVKKPGSTDGSVRLSARCAGGEGEGSGSGPREPDLWLRLARRARAGAGFDSPVDPFAHAGSVCVCLVHRAHAIAAMTGGARPSSRREKAERRLPTAAADLTLATRATAPRHRWWRPPWLPLRRVPLPALQPSSRTRCPRGRHRARRGDRRRACSALGRAGTQTSRGRSDAALGRGPRRATRSRPRSPRR